MAGEHFVSAAVHRRLADAFQSLPAGAGGGPRVVVGLARGARHELGVLAFATVLRSRGVPSPTSAPTSPWRPGSAPSG